MAIMGLLIEYFNQKIGYFRRGLFDLLEEELTLKFVAVKTILSNA